MTIVPFYPTPEAMIESLQKYPYDRKLSISHPYTVRQDITIAMQIAIVARWLNLECFIETTRPWKDGYQIIRIYLGGLVIDLLKYARIHKRTKDLYNQDRISVLRKEKGYDL